MPDAGTIRCHQNIACKGLTVGLHQFLQPLGACFLTHLDHELGIEAELAATRLHHGFHSGHIDRVLSLIVSSATTIDAIAIAGDDPRTFALGPLLFHAAHHVSVTIPENGRQLRILNARCEQNRPLAFYRVLEFLKFETHTGEGVRHLRVEIAMAFGNGRRIRELLALGTDCYAAGKFLQKGAVIKIGLRVCDCGCTASR